MEKHQEQLHKLNNLIHICKDAEHGFRLAASEVDDPKFRSMLFTASRQRANFATQLQEEVHKMGERPARKGNLAGLLHRNWLNLRYQLNLRDPEVVVMECLRGEESALKLYQDLFESKILTEMQPVLEDQFQSVMAMRDQLREIVKPGDAEIQSLFHL